MPLTTIMSKDKSKKIRKKNYLKKRHYPYYQLYLIKLKSEISQQLP